VTGAERERDLQPWAIDQAEGFDDEVRTVAMRLLRTKLDQPDHWYAAELDEAMTNARLREIVDCLASMAVGAFLEYYRGDRELAAWTIAREQDLAEELHNVVADDLQPPEDDPAAPL
jgi:hypothetical protein